MKRYIRASFDPSMPDWLKAKFDDRFSDLGRTFVRKYGLALSDVEFLDEPTENSIKIYKLVGDRGITKVYIPGVNEDEEISINGRWRKLGNIAKSKLDAMAEDIAYIDRSSAPKRPTDRGYKDPRFRYGRWDGPKGAYAGQYKRANGEWSAAGDRGASERLYRDKSGYQIPTPEMQLARYYKIFPEKITQKVDAIYERILEVKDKVLSPDIINSPRRHDEQMDPGNAMYRLRDAIDTYRSLLNDMESWSKGPKSDWDEGEKQYYQKRMVETVTDSIKNISDNLNEAEHLLTSRW